MIWIVLSVTVPGKRAAPHHKPLYRGRWLSSHGMNGQRRVGLSFLMFKPHSAHKGLATATKTDVMRPSLATAMSDVMYGV